MAKKVRGHRANKPNDSFGTINSETLYRGKYRDEVYEEDDQETSEVEAQQEEAEEQESNESFVETKQETSSDHNYKKRYDDLKKHYDDKVRSFKEREKELESAMSQASQSNISLPKTAEELEKFKEEYPDVYGVVETIASMKASEKSQTLEQEIETLREREKETQVQSAYRELIRNHPDFDEIKTDEKFLTWLQEQPESISDGIYKNNTDARWASRVLDLYKADQGISKKKQSKSNEAAATAVKSPKAKDISSEATGDKKIWKASQIAKMKPWEFEKHEAELDTARAEGRIDYQS